MKPKTVMRRDENTHGQSAQMRHKAINQGLRAGSRLLTAAGEVMVEDLRVGARVITRGIGLATVQRISTHRIQGDTVRILAGSLGDKQPDCDAVLLADQQILIRDWRAKAIYGKPDALVAAIELVDDEFVTLEPNTSLVVFEIEFKLPRILYVDGLELLSYDPKLALATAA